MQLEDLPEEILIIIVKKLDLISVYNLYCISLRFRNIVGSFRTCNLSLSCIAKAQMLKTNFFKDISQRLQDLNLCGMVNLSKSILLPAAKRLKNLISLNVSYTNINIFDLVEVYQLCPSLKRVCINFLFGKNFRITSNVLLQCQEVFKNFECVHFVGSRSNLIYSKLSLCILMEAKLKTLQYTICENDTIAYENKHAEKNVQFEYLQMCFPVSKNSNILYGYMNQLFIFNMLPIQNYEFLIIVKSNIQSVLVYTSTLFENFFSKYFNLTVICLTEFNVVISGNVSIMIWDKKCTTFDDIFFRNLFNKIKIYFPCYYTELDDTNLLLQCDWYIINPVQENIELNNTDCEISFKKRRIAPSHWVLNYDAVCKDKNEVELSFIFKGIIKAAVTLSTSSEYLRKITYLNLSGSVKYSTEFFNILFRCCDKLVTLNVESLVGSSCVASIARSIPLSQTIKNFRLIDRRIDFITLISSLSQCKNLENVNLCDISSDSIVLPDSTAMFQNCSNLYCFYIYGRVNDRTKQLQMLRKAKDKCQKSHMSLNILDYSQLNYDPFIEVFKLCVIKPILFD